MKYKDLIIKLQTELNHAGENLKVDGDFGPKTLAALQKYDIDLDVIVKSETPKSEGHEPFDLNKRSLDNLYECHADLKRLAIEMSKTFDFTVICGHRGEKEQNEAFRKGTSKLKWPNSKHNKKPSLAFDACPNPIDWENRKAFLEMREVAKECAARLGIKIRLISWDLPHIELA